MLLDLVRRARPGTFIDARLTADPIKAIAYRTRQPIIDDINEVPMMTKFGIFKVSAIMSGRTQVGVCVRFRDGITATITQGDHATFVADRVKDIGVAETVIKTNDFLIFNYSSHKALMLKKLTKGRGYGG